MSKFVPKLVTEDRGTFILIDNPFSAEEGIKYAAEHNHNIKFTCGNYTCAVELLYYIQREGYQLEIVERNNTFYIRSNKNIKLIRNLVDGDVFSENFIYSAPQPPFFSEQSHSVTF